MAQMTICSDSADTQTAPSMAGLSLRSSFFWALTGNLVYAACQWGMIVALAKLGSSFMVGQFSLGLAIATPVLMFTNLQLRSVQATDAMHQYSFQEYLGLRMTTTLVGVIAIACITWIGGYQRVTAMVILAVGCAKGFEALSDIFYGLFQLNDRLDQTATSMMLRGILSMIGLGLGLYLTRQVFWGALALALIWMLVLISFDARRSRLFLPPIKPIPLKQDWKYRWAKVRPRFSFRHQWKLVRLTFPLGIVMMLVSLNLNMPRYFVHSYMGEHQLGIFSALAYATVALTLVADAMGHSAIPGMARLFASGDIVAFRTLLLKLVAFGVLLGTVGAILAKFLGHLVLTISYSPVYAAHAGVFVWLMSAAGVSCAASLFTYGITASRSFRIQVPLFALVVGSNALACAVLVPVAGLRGAAIAVFVAAVVHLIIAAVVVQHLFSTGKKDAACAAAANAYYEHWDSGL